MQHLSILLVLTLLVIAGAAVLAPRLRIPSQLILVLAGIAISLRPATAAFVIDPELVLLGMLPPLLYASATTISATNFRRDFRAINGLSVVLVVVSSLALGRLFTWLIPGLGFGWGVALGAILSPTDAVATSIVKGRGVPGRVLVILEGESLLNDASALVVLRTAIIATSVGFSFWQTLFTFAYSVAIAIAVGSLAAVLNIAVRRRVHEEAVSTILSFTTPFAAAVPAEMLHGSGLVAAVTAGLVAGLRAPRDLPPGHRLSDARNWASVQLVLEGLIFLTMGLQLSSIFRQVSDEAAGVGSAAAIALIALAAMLLIRAAYVGPLLAGLRRSAKRGESLQSKVVEMQADLQAGRIPQALGNRARPLLTRPTPRAMARMMNRVRRGLADIDYLTRQPLGFAEGALVVWAGMRGAVTVAAAQLLPPETPHRSFMILVAFLVATSSLILQGGTVGLFAARLFPGDAAEAAQERARQNEKRIQTLLEDATSTVVAAELSEHGYRLAVFSARRKALLDARDDGLVDADIVQVAIRDVDVDELVFRLRARPPA